MKLKITAIDYGWQQALLPGSSDPIMQENIVPSCPVKSILCMHIDKKSENTGHVGILKQWTNKHDLGFRKKDWAEDFFAYARYVPGDSQIIF